jgi:hypothetical protein
MTKLLKFLEQLEVEKIWYRLGRVRDAIMVEVAVPGERWEIEFFADGVVEVERFISPGRIEGEEAIAELFARYKD